MQLDIGIENEVLYDSLCINLDQSITTLQSNYYINQVCLAYSKFYILEMISQLILNFDAIECTIEEYDFIHKSNFMFNEQSSLFVKDKFSDNISQYVKVFNFDNDDPAASKWYDFSDCEDIKVFFRLFDAFERPLVYVREKEKKTSVRYVHTLKTSISSRFSSNNAVLVHDFNINALKVLRVKHFSPPEYIVKGIEDLLKYLITDKREEELRKLELCLKRQEFLYKEMDIVEKVVSISRVLNDDNVDGRIKLYVSNTLYTVLEQQNKLHEKLGIKPTIEHIDFQI